MNAENTGKFEMVTMMKIFYVNFFNNKFVACSKFYTLKEFFFIDLQLQINSNDSTHFFQCTDLLNHFYYCIYAFVLHRMKPIVIAM